MAELVVMARCPICGLEIDTKKFPADAAFLCPRNSCGVELKTISPTKLRAQTFRLHSHFSLCVLPFTISDGAWEMAINSLGQQGRWKARTFSLDNQEDVDRTEYFLPYIRKFLFPTLFEKSAGGELSKRTCWQFEFDLAKLGSPSAEGLQLTLTCRDTRKNLEVDYPLLLEKIELHVFSFRVGFLTLRFRGQPDDTTYFDQMECLAYLRTIAPLYRGFEMPIFDAGSGARFQIMQLIPYLLAEFNQTPSIPSTINEMKLGSPYPVQPAYDDRMMVYTFTCVDKGSTLKDGFHSQNMLERFSIIPFDKRSTSRPQGEEFSKHPEKWKQQRWSAFSKDGGSLIVFNTDRFHAKFLGGYHGTYYFDIFLLAALQRVTLLSLYEKFSDIQSLIRGSGKSRDLLRRVRRDLLLFKNQCWFSQITNREKGLVLWKKWRKVFENNTLVHEVNEQSEELNTYLQARYRERMEILVRIGGFLAAALPVIWGLEKVSVSKDTQFLLVGLLALGAACFAGFVLFWRREDL